MGLCVMYICTDVMGHWEALKTYLLCRDLFQHTCMGYVWKFNCRLFTIMSSSPVIFFANVYQNAVAMWLFPTVLWDAVAVWLFPTVLRDLSILLNVSFSVFSTPFVYNL